VTKFEKDKTDLARAKALFERDRIKAKRRVISRAPLDNAGKAYEEAQARVALAETAVAQREAALRTAEKNLAETTIVARADGTIVSRSAVIGQSVVAGSDGPALFLIATDLTVVQVTVKVSEKDIHKIKLGDKASITVESIPDHSFKGEVIEIRQSAQAGATASDVVIRALNPDILLKSEMTTTVEIAVAHQAPET
jgi:HlyD family secretion protein